MKTINQEQNHNNFYVYKVYHNDELVYVGKGQCQRVKHVLSGASHNKNLNELYYRCKFESTSLPTIELEYFETEKLALDREHHLIYTCKPWCNINLKYCVPEDYKFEEEFCVDDTFILDNDNYWEED